ncbi:MAG: tetratricopeptide repeat protein, partial [Microcystaceae cyanobacterium]
PNDYWAWYQQGQIFQKINRWQAAIECYQRALDSNPGDDYAWYEQALCNGFLGHLEEALFCLEKAMEVAPRTYLELAEKEPALLGLREKPRYQALKKRWAKDLPESADGGDV